MNRNCIARALGLLALVVLALALAGCGSTESAATTPPAQPPLPPPFQPAPVEVTLGEHGGTVTLMTAEGGGFTLNGRAFDGGEVTAENGNVYALSLVDGQWTAAYQAATATLTLGITGEEVTLTRAEDGSYSIGDDAFEPGGNVVASNGNQYMLALAGDGSWSVSYVPATATATLGITGEEVTLTRAEDGSYRIGDNTFSSGGIVKAANGSEYTLTMADGAWTAAYVPAVQQVAIGNSGVTVPFTRHENGTWTAVYPTMGEQRVVSGVQVPLGTEMYLVEQLGDGMWRISYVPKTVPVILGISGESVTLVKAENGLWSIGGAPFRSGEVVAAGFGTYTLRLGPGDTWMAAFNEIPTIISLGTSGDLVTVVMVEDGSYTLDGDPFGSGGEVTARNGNVYRLTLAEGAWSVMFVPVDVEIQGTGLTAMTREDQDGWDVNGVRVPKSGTGDITVDGASYHVWRVSSDLFGARFDKAIDSGSDADSTVEAGFGLAGDLTIDNRMTLSGDDDNTVANELRTSLTVGGSTFAIADLLGAGSASATGDNFVASARAEIERIRGDVAAVLGLDERPTRLRTVLTARWVAVQAQVDEVFGAGRVSLGEAPANDDLLDEIDDILDALSSGTQFAAATAAGGGGVFESVALSESDALDAFDANRTETAIVFGATEETRYGAISQKERESATSGLAYKSAADNTAAGLVGAFSYGTIDDIVRVWQVQTAGTAYYEGGTTAASGDGTLYSGNFELEVRFGTRRVYGLITDLKTAEGDPWRFAFGDVGTIILPKANVLTNSGHWLVAGNASTTFELKAGSPSPQTVTSTFAGQLLGTGDTSGDWVHGIWTVGTQTESGTSSYLAGAFGATRVADHAPLRPGTDDGSVAETLVKWDWENDFTVADGKLTVTMKLLDRLPADSVTESLPLGPYQEPTVTTVTNVLEARETAPPGGARILDGWVDNRLLALDTDPETIRLQQRTLDLSVDLSTLIDNAGTEVTINGPRTQVEIAVDAIEKARDDLAVLLGLGFSIPDSEVAAWKRVQRALLGLFHHVPANLAGSYDPDNALGLIDSVLYALASSANLKVALDPDGTGVFSGVVNYDGGPVSYSHIWAQPAVQMSAWANATDYTRFGGWIVRQNAYAAKDADHPWWETIIDLLSYGPSFIKYTSGRNQPGLFAYSPLGPTQWPSASDPSFPGGARATYFGRTVAVGGDGLNPGDQEFYEGRVELLAQWNTAWAGSESDSLRRVGNLTMSITGLASANGDPILRWYPRIELDEIVIPGIGIYVETATDQVVFEEDDIDVTFKFEPLGTDTLDSRDQSVSVSGNFVGQDVDGPLAVLGQYLIDTGRLSRTLIVGSFGADRP